MNPKKSDYTVLTIVILGLLIAFTYFIYDLKTLNQKEDTFKIGIMVPLSGWRADGGKYLKEGYDLAFEEAKPELKEKIKLIYEDTRCEPMDTSSALIKLHSIDQVDLLMGPHCGTETKVAEKFAEDNKVLIVSPGDNFGKINEYFFPVNTPVPKDGEEAARYMIADDIKTAAVIYFDNDWGHSIYKSFIKAYPALGGEVVLVEPHAVEETDFRTHITKAMSNNPDAIFIPLAPNAVKQIKEMNQNISIYTTWYFEEPQIKESYGQYSEGVKYAYPQKTTGEEYNEFVKRFNKKYNYDPPLLSVTSYLNMKLGLELIEKCDKDQECMREILLSLKKETMLGTLTFNDDFWGIDREYVYKIFKDGDFREYEN